MLELSDAELQVVLDAICFAYSHNAVVPASWDLLRRKVAIEQSRRQRDGLPVTDERLEE